jgi:nicotinic acid phosphoribosyltransferase
MACLPGKTYGAQQVIVRQQIGGFTVACGYWKWLEFLSHPITHEEVDLVADFFSGHHNNYARQFDKDYWHDRVVHQCGGYLPIRVEFPGEGAVFTGVPFPIAQIYGERPALWLNEPLYIQIGQLCHVATIAAQFTQILGDAWRFIEVGFRALHNKEASDDFLLAMLVGGGIISTSNDLGAMINGAPFKPSGTTGHCYYQQYESEEEALKALLTSPLGRYSTVLLDLFSHERGFKVLQKLIREGYPAPFAERPDSGDTLNLGMHDLTALQDDGHSINVVFEDGYEPVDVLNAETMRKQYALDEKRAIYGAGGAFIGARQALETAYKACHFHNGTIQEPTDKVDTMKICLDDPMKQSIPGMIDWFLNEKKGLFMLGCAGDDPLEGYHKANRVLYDGLSDPGRPYINTDYDPSNLTMSPAVVQGQARCQSLLARLGPDFTRKIEPNRFGVAMTQALREKRKAIVEKAKALLAEQ